MIKRFADNIVLVTGGSTGIGQATALAFAREGAKVVITSRQRHAGEKTAALLKAEQGDACFIQADVTVEADMARLLEQIVARYDRLDIAFNNAGSVGTGAITEIKEALWDETIASNLKGTWLSMKYELQQMLTQGSGTIVNMSSNLGGHVARPMMAPYAAAKAGVLALTQVAALEYIQSGIRINAVSPGPIRTPLSKRVAETDEERDRRVADTLPIGRIGLPEEVAHAVLWLSSSEASFVVGHDIVLDGGFIIQ
ncbi:short-chain dehydrogenase [Ktedonobacter sp. SOSP1-52]|uniref:glucose 1-dehydrogenase n=1 Tax=Ktedonobacter sp. SOSP1-52 TaxID=2778366 RepID=UPI00191512F8|nr:glucose 1-dehydrogenase [Ktedonobacter sp. SOSP1-52]GHO61202.1 short-chain dehydrogenase [Ktedonobacter sp. SOSP1-52]